jgi:predicted SAM-dependent methyltransferase
LPASVVVVVPVYKPALDPLEEFSLDRSLSVLKRRKTVFVAPHSLDRNYYSNRYPGHAYVTFADDYFTSAKSYSRLLLTEAFYTEFTDSEFLLILQPDAIVFRDELDYWCAQSYDYIGAPWPNGINLDPDTNCRSQQFEIVVGNGGLSLRRVAKCINLLQEHHNLACTFAQNSANEDLFFALMGKQSVNFTLPDELTASRFSIEESPSEYIQRNGNHIPMGAHRWWGSAPELWASHLEELPPTIRAELDRLQGGAELNPTNLHIGGQQVKPGWKILNIQPAPGVDYVGDICDLSQFSDNMFDNIYASHVFEHIKQTDALPTLQGIHRILKQGGSFYISVPDLGTLAKLITSPNVSLEDEWHIMRMIFGGQTAPYDFHYCGWTFASLSHFLKLAGFDDIHQVTFFNLFNDASGGVKNGTPISLNLIAKKLCPK